MPKTCLLIFITLLFCGNCSRASEIDSLLRHYQHLHQHPELSLQETNTASYLGAELQAMGYEVTRGVGGYGVVAMLDNGSGKTIMYRADMDALPVEEQTGLPYKSKVTTKRNGESVPVMHACGHDVHMTVLLGVAQEMVKDRDHWQGRLILILQPAEEIGAGAKNMLADGLFKRFPLPDYNLAFHVTPDLPAGKIAYVSGYAMANVDSVDITVFGVGGHGAFPHKAKDPVVIASQIVLALQTIISRELSPLEPAVITVGSIHGGTKNNIIPDEVKLQLTVRSYADEIRDFLLSRIREISEGIARTAGMPDDKLPRILIKDEYTPSVYNNPQLIERIVPVLQKALGNESVVETQAVMGGEDFARYGRTEQKIPGAMLFLGATNLQQFLKAQANGENLPALHSPFFAPDARPTITTGVTSMTAILEALFLKAE